MLTKTFYKQKRFSKIKEKKNIRKRSFVLEFKKIKQEIEHEIRKEKKGLKVKIDNVKRLDKKDYCKSLFSSSGNQLDTSQTSTRKIRFKHSKNSVNKQSVLGSKD